MVHDNQTNKSMEGAESISSGMITNYGANLGWGKKYASSSSTSHSALEDLPEPFVLDWAGLSRFLGMPKVRRLQQKVARTSFQDSHSVTSRTAVRSPLHMQLYI